MKPTPTAVISLALAMALAVGACGGGANDSDGGARVKVVASFFPIAEAVRSVGGDLVDVSTLTPAGAEPHDLELSSGQVDQIHDADLVVYLGGGFQPGVEEVSRKRRGAAVDLGEGLRLRAGETPGDNGEDDDHGDEASDPHFWLDPMLMSKSVDRVERALVEKAPRHAEAFAANADSYRAALAALDREFREGLGACARRAVVTAHAAFHYLTERYDLEQIPIAGLSPEAEPGAQRVAELAELIAERGVTTVFYESMASPGVAETLAREAGVKTAVLNPLETLAPADAKAGKDYVAVIRENLRALSDALGCA